MLNYPRPLICSIKPLNPLNRYELNLQHLQHGRQETRYMIQDTGYMRQETGDVRQGDRKTGRQGHRETGIVGHRYF